MINTILFTAAIVSPIFVGILLFIAVTVPVDFYILGNPPHPLGIIHICSGIQPFALTDLSRSKSFSEFSAGYEDID